MFDHPRCQNSTVSHTLEDISNQPSTAVPAQINSSRNGLTHVAEAKTTYKETLYMYVCMYVCIY